MRSSEAVTGDQAADPLLAAVGGLLGQPLAPLSDDDVVQAMRDVERCVRQLAVVQQRLLVEVSERSIPAHTGAKTTKRFLMETLRLSSAEAGARVHAAAGTGVFHDLTGEARDPQLPRTAAAQAAGEISVEHARAIARVMRRIPNGIPGQDQEAAEEILAEFACGGSPDDIPKVGDGILAHLDPDGRLSDDTDRARMRGVTLGRQRPDGMSPIRGEIDPVLRALLDPLLAKYARPGMCNPDDPDSPTTDPGNAAESGRAATDSGSSAGPGSAGAGPGSPADSGCAATDSGGRADSGRAADCGGPTDSGRAAADCGWVDPQVLAAAAARDRRTAAQRTHDALRFVLESLLDRDQLGTHRGMPVTAVLTMDIDDLERMSGTATTATGGTVPLPEALTLAGRSQPFLAVFDRSGLPLHLSRMRRLASPAQRLALIAALRGCSRPGCDAPASLCAVHHVHEYRDGGTTDIENLVLACDACHALIHDGPGGWKTVALGKDSAFPGRTGWIAPAHIDPARTPQVNHRHQAAELLAEVLTRIHARHQRERDERLRWLRRRDASPGDVVPQDNSAAA